MKYAQILDCTLRDGGYLVNKEFGDHIICGIINGLVQTGIDIIELGFLQNEGSGKGRTVFLNSCEAEEYMPQIKGKSLFTAFADISRYNPDNLDLYTGRSFEAVRVCFFKKELNRLIEYCKKIKKKGYLLFIQPVDVLGYTDTELIKLIEMINPIEPYCFSIVDTFGSMYEEDLYRIFSLVDHNLIHGSKVGFHSHNNLQMSSALSQVFLKYAFGKREVVVDTTISGMGRGAGNTPTELIVQYMTDKLGYDYDIDCLLDIIDNYMRNIKSRAEWGYSTPLYLAGAYNAHVNNISYLTKKNSICSKDIRYILNDVGIEERKRYDYDLLESKYIKYVEMEIDDVDAIFDLKKVFNNRNVVILAPGKSIVLQNEDIIRYISENNALVVAINYEYQGIQADYLYMNNIKRYNMWINERGEDSTKVKKIFTSNIKTSQEEKEYVISLKRIIKCGWENMDNSTILLLRLLCLLQVKKIGLAGFDGYSYENNYAEQRMEYGMTMKEAMLINRELEEMLLDFKATKPENLELEFITESRFDSQKNGERLGGG